MKIKKKTLRVRKEAFEILSIHEENIILTTRVTEETYKYVKVDVSKGTGMDTERQILLRATKDRKL